MHSRPFVAGANPALLAVILLLLGLLLPAGSAEAQSHRTSLTVLGGASNHQDLTSGLDFRTELQTGWIAGIQAERWLGEGRAGVRLNGLVTQRMLKFAPGDYNVYSADLDLLVRLLSPRPDRVAAPYVALGVGATRYASVAGSPVFARGIFGSNPVHRAHLLAGLGVDVPSSGRLGLRLEAADKIVLPSVGRSPETAGFPMAHNLVLTAGLQLRMGAPRETQVADRPSAIVTIEDRRADPVGGQALYTVQIFTFVEAATADRWAARLRERNVPVWLLDSVLQGQRVSRVRVGALESEAEARSLAATLERDYGWTAWVDRIEADEPMQANAVRETRAFLSRQ